ncbi:MULTISPECIES: S1C family serine protease [Bacillaceae]|uniref:Trypsin-like peptidase domain-containing protein n=1 Tax=Evansella alkalicola TaxID=745819 RepID=A0ABS6JXD6_9BACI|nr:MULTISPECIES: serine protease [Bacillaceae]MBU9723168.1 trypsin-like peptidase domain-containing protein [Bacillus alkalicola]
MFEQYNEIIVPSIENRYHFVDPCQEGDIISYRDDENSTNSHDEKQHKAKEDELYFDGEKYYTREEFFNPEDEEETKPPKKKRWLRVTIASILTIALLTNVWQMWPRLFNFDSIEFIQISRELSQNDDVQLYKESIVVVRAGGSKGTGFYISEDGYIITNQHVVDDANVATVTFQGGDAYRAEVIETNEEIDIAVLHITDDAPDHPVLEFHDTWERDMDVYVIGNPLFFNFIANRGHVIGMTEGREVPFLMLDAPIYRGNSGSPVINQDGKVVGVVFATSRIDVDGERMRVGLSVPVDYLKNYLEFEIEVD